MCILILLGEKTSSVDLRMSSYLEELDSVSKEWYLASTDKKN